MACFGAAPVHDHGHQFIASCLLTGRPERDVRGQGDLMDHWHILALDFLQHQQTILHMLVVSFEHRHHCRRRSKPNCEQKGWRCIPSP